MDVGDDSIVEFMVLAKEVRIPDEATDEVVELSELARVRLL